MAMSGENPLGCLFALIGLAVSLAVTGFFSLLLYGVAVIVFRMAFGIELPDPISWLPTEWQERLR